VDSEQGTVNSAKGESPLPAAGTDHCSLTTDHCFWAGVTQW
jgi:hypothetical protein